MPKNPKIHPVTIINPIVEEYCLRHSSSLSKELQEIEQYTKENILAYRMLSNSIQAHFLITITKMINPQKILEIGTFTGYSTICFAQNSDPKSKIVTIEKKKEFVQIAQKFFQKFGYTNIQIIQGNALEVLDTINDSFDLIYLDADKENYIEYYNKLIRLLSEKGWLIIDNTLWKGLVTTTAHEPITKKMQLFNDFISKQKNIFTITLPIRDGITLIHKH